MDVGGLPPDVQEYIAQLEKKAAHTTQLEEEKAALSAQLEEKTAYNRQLEEKTAPTTLSVFLEKCHAHLSVPLRVPNRTGPYLVSTLTSPKERYCPKRIMPWRGFDRDSRKSFDRISAIYHPDTEPAPKPFPNTAFISGLGEAVQERQLSSENDLRIHERTNMEDMVTRVVKDIVNRGALEDYDLDQGVAFENHANNLSTGAPEVRARLEEAAASSDSDPMPKPVNVDQMSVVKHSRGGNTVSFLIEYKSPFKLPKEVLRQGLRSSLDLEEIINRPWISTDAGEKFAENAEYAVAAVITQLYSYMLKAGIAHGYLSTGEIYLFLQIPFAKPEVVYYHLAEPNVDVEDEDREKALAYTAISQVVCFCLRASSSTRRNQQWRRDAKTKALKWAVNPEKVLAQMTPIKYKAETPPSEYKPPGRPASRRQTLAARSRTTCKDDTVETPQDPESSSDDQPPDPESPSARPRHTGVKATKATQQEQAGRDNAGKGHKQRVPYCTHKCLQGVVRRSRLDPECPNRALHPSTKRLRHMIDAPTLSTLLRNQLDSDMDHNCTPLDIQGARGALFKLTLASHGYTFVGKGTVRAFVPDLRHEGRIYRQLRTLQGTSVPICLGNIDCIYPYELDIDVEIIHFLLLSWAGVAVGWVEYAARQKEVNELEKKLTALGVEHEDERCLNVLRNEPHGQLMLIDFERATLHQAGTALQAGQGKQGAKLPLGEVSSNVPMKRGWEVDATGDVIGLKLGRQTPGHEQHHSLSI